MKKIVLLLMSLLIFLGITVAGLYGYYWYNYERQVAEHIHGDPALVGYVPDQQTAIRVAEALWLPLFGEGIYDEQPFVATLEDSVWVVKGTLKEGWRGGVPYAKIRKKDCKILRIYHSQ